MQTDGFNESIYHRLTMAHSRSVFNSLQVIMKNTFFTNEEMNGVLLFKQKKKNENAQISNLQIYLFTFIY